MSQKMAIQEQQLQDLTRKESLRNINEKSMSSKRKKEDMNLGEDEELGFDMTKELLEAMVSKLTQPLVAMCQSIQDRQELFSIQVAKLIESQSKSPPQTKIIQEIKEVQRTSVKSAANKHKVMTYAEAIAKSPLAPENIRNINITGTPEEVSRISTILRKDNVLQEYPILSIRPKGPANFTFKYADSTTADNVSKLLSTKYHGALTVERISPTLPQLKITKLYTSSNSIDEIVEQIRMQNQWITPEDIIKSEQFYEICPSKAPAYKNLVISTTLETFKKNLKKGFVVFGFSESKVYEYINTLQCNQCLRYGHFSRDCRFPPNCKKCTLNHNTQECVATKIPSNLRCINCVIANQKGAQYSTRHRPTDERCQSRDERIEALIKLHLAKN